MLQTSLSVLLNFDLKFAMHSTSSIYITFWDDLTALLNSNAYGWPHVRNQLTSSKESYLERLTITQSHSPRLSLGFFVERCDTFFAGGSLDRCVMAQLT